MPNGIKTSTTESEMRSSLAGVDKLFEECMNYLLRTRILRSAPVGSGQGTKPLLVCGGTGCGKTAMTKEIAERLAADRHVLAGENTLFFRPCLIVVN
jgi:Cdc6-like AAA superfamily ATPase